MQEAEGGSYELVPFNADAGTPSDGTAGTHRGPGLAAVFLARNRFAVLDKNRQVRPQCPSKTYSQHESPYLSADFDQKLSK